MVRSRAAGTRRPRGPRRERRTSARPPWGIQTRTVRASSCVRRSDRRHPRSSPHRRPTGTATAVSRAVMATVVGSAREPPRCRMRRRSSWTEGRRASWHCPRSPRPCLAIAVAHRVVRRAPGRPRPSRGSGAVEVPPEVRIAPEAVVAGGADAVQHAHGPAAEPEPVAEPVLRRRQFDQMGPADRCAIERHAVRRGVRARIDHQRRVRTTGNGSGAGDTGFGQDGCARAEDDRQRDRERTHPSRLHTPIRRREPARPSRWPHPAPAAAAAAADRGWRRSSNPDPGRSAASPPT